MKTTSLMISLLTSVAVLAAAQTPPATLSAGAKTPGSDSAYNITERGPHHRVWARVSYETNALGEATAQTNSYTELETGMNVRQPDGSYVEASDEIEIMNEGAVARKGRHQVIFSVNCNTPVAIDMLTADGKRLQSRILGLAFYDTATGESVLIAEIKDSDGQLLMDARNEVIYYDALTDIKCDIRYRNSKAGLEQDLILRENPPSPADYKLSPATTVLEVLTEFFDAPVPEKKERFVNGSADEFLDFGDLKMGNGRVFVMGEEATEIAVTKQWGTLDGRTFLMEEIPYQTVVPALDALPGRTASLMTSPDGVLHRVSVRRLLPTFKQAKKGTGPMKLASAPLSGKGVVLDYTAASSATNYTFKGDTTYYVSGTVNLSGTNTIFEGGTVIKYAPTNTPKLNVTSPITWQGSVYRQIVMTARDDSTVGEGITGSTGNPNTNYFANPALYIDGTVAGTNAVLQNLRIAYAQSAIVFNGRTGHVVSHAQLVNCANGITATNAEFSLRNALLYNVLTNFNGSSATGHCEHLTINTASWMNKSNAITLTLTNSLLVGVTNAGTFTSNSVSTATSAAFVTVGAASHYLADSNYRNSGTTNINANLAAALKKLTTYPPLELTNDFTLNTTLSPQAQRDTDTPDRGYHYDPLDYVVSGRTLTNSTLTLTNGVAIGTYGSSSSHGISIVKDGKLISEGSPPNPNHIVRYNTVQEQASTNWSASTVAHSIKFGTSTGQDARCRFTDWSLLGNNGHHFYASTGSSTCGFQDCQFGGGRFFIYDITPGLTNCLWERVANEAGGSSSSFYMYNNLTKGGSWTFTTYSYGWIARDNMFDSCILNSVEIDLTSDHNAYVNVSVLSGTGGSDKTLTNAAYQIGSLGRYYYPTNGGQLSTLIGAGSRNATNATLYHYTVTTNQVKEASSTVDIGFHYVAVNGSGQPLDTDSDGVPDYLEDRNGDGNGANDPTSWQTYNSPNGLTGGAGLQVFTPLKP